MRDQDIQDDSAIDHVVKVAVSYLAHNQMPAADVPALLLSLRASFDKPLPPSNAPTSTEAIGRPTAAQIRKSLRPDHLVSFEDGKPYKTLRRHLTSRGLTPEAYREKWSLPPDYPMTAASFSARRSAISMAVNADRTRFRPRPLDGVAPVYLLPIPVRGEPAPSQPTTATEPREGEWVEASP